MEAPVLNLWDVSIEAVCVCVCAPLGKASPVGGEVHRVREENQQGQTRGSRRVEVQWAVGEWAGRQGRGRRDRQLRWEAF